MGKNKHAVSFLYPTLTNGIQLVLFLILLITIYSCAKKEEPSPSPEITDEISYLMDFMAGKTPRPEKEEIERMGLELGKESMVYLAQTANHWQRQYEYDSAGFYYRKLLEMAEEVTHVPLKAEVLKNLGAIAYYQEDFPGSIQIMLSALNEYETFRDTNGIASIQNNIGSIYYSTKDYDLAMDFFQKSLVLKEKLPDSLSLSRTLNNIGNVWADKGDHTMSLEYNLRALHIKEKVQPDNFSSLGASYNNIALNYKNLGQLKEAASYALKCLDANEKANNKEGIAYAHNTLAIIYFEQKDMTSAGNHALTNLDIAREIKSIYLQERANLVLSNIYIESGQPARAFDYLKASVDLKDSLLNEEKNKAIAELQEKYETVKKEKEIQQLQSEKIIQIERARKDRQLKIFLIAFLSALVLLLVSLWAQYRQKLRTNRLLEETNLALGELNALKDRLFATLTHDLKGPVSSFQAITTALSENIQRLEKEQIKSYLISLQQSSAGISHTLHNLLNWAKSQKGLQTVSIKDVSLSSVLDEIISQLDMQLQEKNLIISRQFIKDLLLKTDKDILEITLRNLISNAIKYSPNEGVIIISCETGESGYQISVEDQGAGMPLELQLVLFDPVERNKYDHKERKEGSGIGLILVKESLEKIQASIQVFSETGKGTRFRVNIP